MRNESIVSIESGGNVNLFRRQIQFQPERRERAGSVSCVSLTRSHCAVGWKVFRSRMEEPSSPRPFTQCNQDPANNGFPLIIHHTIGGADSFSIQSSPSQRHDLRTAATETNTSQTQRMCTTEPRRKSDPELQQARMEQISLSKMSRHRQSAWDLRTCLQVLVLDFEQ